MQDRTAESIVLSRLNTILCVRTDSICTVGMLRARCDTWMFCMQNVAA